ncbi:MAG: DUF4118 domain-containing protein, partial [Serpentinimonas sp.]|nr:DUF4118 domain-containing protein [Serpentinimonas sp.]
MSSNTPASATLLRPHGWRAAAVWAVAWMAMLALDGRLELTNLALMLVLAAAVASLWLAPWASLVASSLAVAVFNWTFVPPRGTFAVDLRQHALLLVAMLGVSWIVALLMARQRLLAARAEDQARRAEQLHHLGDALRDTDDPVECAALLRDALAALCSGPVTLLLLNGPLPERDDADAARLVGEADADMRAGLWQSLRHSVAFGPG